MSCPSSPQPSPWGRGRRAGGDGIIRVGRCATDATINLEFCFALAEPAVCHCQFAHISHWPWRDCGWSSFDGAFTVSTISCARDAAADSSRPALRFDAADGFPVRIRHGSSAAPDNSRTSEPATPVAGQSVAGGDAWIIDGADNSSRLLDTRAPKGNPYRPIRSEIFHGPIGRMDFLAGDAPLRDGGVLPHVLSVLARKTAATADALHRRSHVWIGRMVLAAEPFLPGHGMFVIARQCPSGADFRR